jgi:hypothetical protein
MQRPAILHLKKATQLRRLITDPAELRDLDHQLALGLRLHLRPFQKGSAMFGKTKSTTYTIEAATAELDAILARAAAAFVPADRLVDLMESRIAAIRARQAAAYSSVPAFVSGNL